MKITVDVWDVKSIDSAIKQLNEYRNSLDRKARELCERLANMGAMYAEWYFSGVMYAGDVDYKITVDQINENTYAINASGDTVLFMEFGTGIKHGYGHPQAEEFGFGPGTYPKGKGYWDDPRGWWFKQGGEKIHTYGNAPGMPMYNTAKDLREEILKVAQEVFQEK